MLLWHTYSYSIFIFYCGETSANASDGTAKRDLSQKKEWVVHKSKGAGKQEHTDWRSEAFGPNHVVIFTS